MREQVERQPVLDPAYWADRLAKARITRHAVYNCSLEEWVAHERRHRAILNYHLGASDSVLDAGCGLGLLINVLPDDWAGRYTGVDLSPDLLRRARIHYPDRTFVQADLRSLPFRDGEFDVAVLRSVKYTLLAHCPPGVWQEVEREVRRVARRLLFLEFDKAEEPVKQEGRR